MTNAEPTYYLACSTPEAHRATLADWASKAPANDSDIFARKAKSAAPRHRALQDEFRPLLVWRALHETAEADCLASGWMSGIGEDFGAANDNERVDGDHEIIPTPEEIVDRLVGVEMAWIAPSRQSPAIGESRTYRPYVTPGRLVVTGGDIERDEDSRLVRIGGLRLSSVQPGAVTAFKIEKQYRRGTHVYWLRPKERLVEQVGPKTPPPPKVEPTHPDEAFDARRATQRLRDRLSPETIMVLDLAVRAANFKDIGFALGKQGRNAEVVGKARVQLACIELQEALNAQEARTPLAA